MREQQKIFDWWLWDSAFCVSVIPLTNKRRLWSGPVNPNGRGLPSRWKKRRLWPGPVNPGGWGLPSRWKKRRLWSGPVNPGGRGLPSQWKKAEEMPCASQGLGLRTPCSTAPCFSDKPAQDQPESTRVYSSEGRGILKRRTRVHGQQPAPGSRNGGDVILDLPAQETLQIKAAR